MSSANRSYAPGPFTADQIRAGDPYELSNGHPIYCLPTGRRGGRANLTGGSVLETDPAVKSAGVDVGFSDNPKHLRAPAVSVGDFEDAPGWATEAPPLAVEYADRGQDEADLQAKIREVFEGGTQHVWIVRLHGPRRVEVHTRDMPMRLARYGDVLTAPGILQNPVPVEALFDREAAHEATLRNLLQRKGFASLEAVREEGKLEGKLESKLDSLHQILVARGIALTAAQRRKIDSEEDMSEVDAWIAKALVVTSAKELFKGRS
ncbi:MAG: Uma2 family endonuclease [Polyangiaceae bacterium]|nr:Uma2 family endonuclease [Polyangiaceae bacterium]